jgi:hypothetical protein
MWLNGGVLKKLLRMLSSIFISNWVENYNI